MSIPWLAASGNGLATNLYSLSLARSYASQVATAASSSRRKTDQQERAIRRTEQLKRARRKGGDQDDPPIRDTARGDRRPQRYASPSSSSRKGGQQRSRSSPVADSTRERRFELSSQLKQLRDRIRGSGQTSAASEIYEEGRELVARSTRASGHSAMIYNQLIDIAFLAGKKSEAIGLFDDMKKRGIHPSMLNYSTLLGGFVRSGINPDRETALFARIEAIMEDIDAIRSEAFPRRSSGDTALHFSETLEDDKLDKPRRRDDDDDEPRQVKGPGRRELIVSIREQPLDLMIPYVFFTRLMFKAGRSDAAWSIVSQFSHKWQLTKDGFPRLTGGFLERLMGTWYTPGDPPLSADDAQKLAGLWQAYKNLLYESSSFVLLEWQTARGRTAKDRVLQEWQQTIASSRDALYRLLTVVTLTRQQVLCDTAIEMLSFLTNLNVLPERKAEELSKLPEEARDQDHPFYMLQSFVISLPPDKARTMSGRMSLLSNVVRTLGAIHDSSSYAKSPVFYDLFIGAADAALLQSRDRQAVSSRARGRSDDFDDDDDVKSMTEEEEDRQQTNVLKQRLLIMRALSNLEPLPRAEAEGKMMRLIGTARRLYFEGLIHRPPTVHMYYRAMAIFNLHKIVNTQLGKWWLEDRRHIPREMERPWNVWSINTANFYTSNLWNTIRTGPATSGASDDQARSSSSDTAAAAEENEIDTSDDANVKLTKKEAADVAAAAMRLHDNAIDDGTKPSISATQRRIRAMKVEIEDDEQTEERRLFARAVSLDFLKQWRASFGLPLKGSTTIEDDSLFPRPSDLEAILGDTAGLDGQHRFSFLFRLIDLCSDLSSLTRKALDTGKQGSDFLPEPEVIWIKAFRRRVIEVRERAEVLLEEEEGKDENKNRSSALLPPVSSSSEGQGGRPKSVRERKSERYARGPIRGGTDRHRVVHELQTGSDRPRRRQSDRSGLEF